MPVPVPHPASDTYAAAYSDAWTNDPERLLDFFAPNGSYTDVAMGATYRGRDGILKFHRWMLKFALDSVIDFYEPCAQDGRLYLEWTWSGSITGPLRLPSGDHLDAAGKTFSSTGVATCRYDEHGKLTSHRDFWDIGLLAHQLGYSLAGASLHL